MKILKGEKLIRSCNRGRDICPNYMNANRFWHEDPNRITAILAGGIWFYDKFNRTHYDLVCATKAHLIYSGSIVNIKKNLQCDNIATCGRRITKKTIGYAIKDLEGIRQNTYNCRYFPDYECLIFWSAYDDTDLGFVGELVDALNIFSEDLTLAFTNYNSYRGKKVKIKIELASRLKLNVKTGIVATSPLRNISSIALHRIACKKKAIKGFGSYRLKCGMPVSQYNLFRYSGD